PIWPLGSAVIAPPETRARDAASLASLPALTAPSAILAVVTALLAMAGVGEGPVRSPPAAMPDSERGCQVPIPPASEGRILPAAPPGVSLKPVITTLPFTSSVPTAGSFLLIPTPPVALMRNWLGPVEAKKF